MLDPQEARPTPTRPGTQRLFSRRAVLRRAGLVGALFALPSSAARAARMPMPKPKKPPTGALDPTQLATLEAIAARIVPTDALGPGAAEAGAANYINLALAGFPTLRNSLAADFVGTSVLSSLPAYLAGLPAIDDYAKSAKGQPFAKLSTADQDALLTNLERGVSVPGFLPSPAGSPTAQPPQTPGETAPGAGGNSGTAPTTVAPNLTSSAFFTLVRTHTLQGMLCDPYYGGNKGFLGWSWIGYPGIRMPVKPDDQRLGARLPLVRMSAYAMPSYKSGPPTLKG
jgi:gluconate 2-dehydrogenase gamma chain